MFVLPIKISGYAPAPSLPIERRTLCNGDVKLATRGRNPVRHAPFCGPRHVSFALALGLTDLRLLYCHGRTTFFVYSHNASFNPVATRGFGGLSPQTKRQAP